MPLNIIRNDITRVRADAIVNTANPYVAIGLGVDSAIYTAAGRDRLLIERAKIGMIAPGEAAVTPAFDLHAKYIIHTVGPAWEGGGKGETETVARCYRNSLEKARELNCESVAFPLISSGTYGFPKDVALKTAVSEISGFLFHNEMTVYLVVYDRNSFEVSGKAFSDIKSYIEEKDVAVPQDRYEQRMRGHVSRNTADLMHATEAESSERSAPGADSSRIPVSPVWDSGVPVPGAGRSGMPAPGTGNDEMLPSEAEIRGIPVLEKKSSGHLSGLASRRSGILKPPERSALKKGILKIPESAAPGGGIQDIPAMTFPEDSAAAKRSIEDLLKSKEETFQQYLFRIIDRKGLTDPEVYKKANIDRKHFSKIRSNVNYNPSRKTAVALAIALELNLDETKDLLLKAGIALTHSNIFDLIVEYCIEHRITDINEINCILFEYDQPTLGV